MMLLIPIVRKLDCGFGIGHLHDCLGPGEAIEIFELFQHDLDFLPIWRTLSDEMKALISQSILLYRKRPHPLDVLPLHS